VKKVAVLLLVVVGLVVGSVGIASAQADTTPLRPGAHGSDVMALQQALAARGYVVAQDGQYGPQTARAVRHWQKVNGLVVDGIVGPVTAATLHPAQRVDPPPPPPSPVSPEDVIRAVWPDDVEEHALAIAWRESRWTPTARNACCYGLFQINYGAHRAWLAAFGVTSPADLLDAMTNARVALALYQSAGWGPWAL
jgi:hypothetical protein